MATEDAFLSDSTKVNHDLNFLYLIARTVLPKDVLETLMYGEDFEEPTEKDLEEIKMLIEANKYKMNLEPEEPDYEYGCHICGGYH